MSGNRADLLLASDGPPERDPSRFIEAPLQILGAFPGPWNGPRFQRQLERARALSGQARLAMYARLDEELVRELVPFAAYAGWVWPEYFSPRIGCKLFQPYFHFVDLGALCIKKR
jgi:hypothetical protein